MKPEFKNIAKLISDARNEINRKKLIDRENILSQADVSALLGFRTGQFISNIERGLCSIPADRILKLSQILNISIAEIVYAKTQDYKFSLMQTIKATEDINTEEIKLHENTT